MNSEIASGSVRSESLLTMISGQMYMSQASRNVNTPSATSAGLHSGSTICQKMRSSEAPSIRAESIRSFGMPSMYCRIRKTPKPSTRNGTIRPW